MRLPALLFTFSLLTASGASAAPSFTEPVEDASVLDELHARAEECIAVNDFRGAIRAYEDAILLEPDDATAYANMGHAYLILGDPDRAKTTFLSALDIDPENELAAAGFRRLQDPDAAY